MSSLAIYYFVVFVLVEVENPDLHWEMLMIV